VSYNQNAVDIVYDFIVEKIQTGEWYADVKILPETKLAKQLGVSRVAVRGAIQKLAGMSVLRKQQGSGTYVERIDVSSVMSALMPMFVISDQELLGIMEFRTYFEPGNVRQFIRNSTDEDIAALERNYNDMRANRDNPQALHVIDFDFHHMIAKGTRNSFVMRISDFYVDVIKEQQRCISARLGADIALEDHLLVLKYIKEKREDLAMLHMEHHVKRVMHAMRSYLQNTAFP